MRIRESVRIARRSLMANKMRSFLTMLGVIIGVGAVITMISIGRGARADISERIKSLGSNVLTIRPGSQTFGLRRFGRGSIRTLKYDDAKLLKEKWGAKERRTMFLRGLFGGGGSGLTKEQPIINVVRGAYYALAAALGGAQTTALCSYDEAYTIPSEHAAKLSLRTMQILMHEVGLCDTVDPLAGSWFVESTTNLMEKKILDILDDIERQGGIVKSIAEGRLQAEVNRQAWERERRIQAGEIPKVGVNLFVACGISKMSLDRVSRSVVPFIVAEVVALLIITFCPFLSEALPSLLR